MPNDAKLGLLAGVFGVIVAAVVTLNRQPPVPGVPTPNTPQQVAAPKAVGKPVAEIKLPPIPRGEMPANSPAAAPAALPTDLTATPVVRTRKELDATPASRAKDADLDP